MAWLSINRVATILCLQRRGLEVLAAGDDWQSDSLCATSQQGEGSNADGLNHLPSEHEGSECVVEPGGRESIKQERGDSPEAGGGSVLQVCPH